MDLENFVLPSEDPLAIDERPRAHPKVTLATLDLRWLVAAIFAFAFLANLVVPICIEGWERNLSTRNGSIYGFRWSEWIGGMAYGLKLGELLMIGVFLGLGHYHWAKRLLIVSFGTLMLASAHIVGYRWAGWAPPMFVAVLCYLVSFSVTLVVGVSPSTNKPGLNQQSPKQKGEGTRSSSLRPALASNVVAVNWLWLNLSNALERQCNRKTLH
jgi:hypothetical protein